MDPFGREHALLVDQMRFGHDDHAFSRREPKLARARREKSECE